MNNDPLIYKKGCLIILKTRFWGATKKLDNDQLGSLPTEIVKASRDLLIDYGNVNGMGKLEDVRGIIGEARRIVKANTIPFPIPGVDFVNRSRISFLDDQLTIKKDLATVALEELIEIFDMAKHVYKERFPNLYSEDNYPTAEQLRDNFIFEWSFRIMDIPGKDLEILSPEVYEREVANFKGQMKEFEDSLISVVAKEFYDRIDKLKTQCFGGKISSNTVKAVHGIIEKFDSVWDGCVPHDKLNELISDIKKYMGDTSSAMLKADDDFRSAVGEKMREITSTIKLSKDSRLNRKLDM